MRFCLSLSSFDTKVMSSPLTQEIMLCNPNNNQGILHVAEKTPLWETFKSAYCEIYDRNIRITVIIGVTVFGVVVLLASALCYFLSRGDDKCQVPRCDCVSDLWSKLTRRSTHTVLNNSRGVTATNDATNTADRDEDGNELDDMKYCSDLVKLKNGGIT